MGNYLIREIAPASEKYELIDSNGVCVIGVMGYYDTMEVFDKLHANGDEVKFRVIHMDGTFSEMNLPSKSGDDVICHGVASKLGAVIDRRLECKELVEWIANYKLTFQILNSLRSS